MSDRTEKSTQQDLFLHHLSSEEKIKIFKECHIRLNWYKDSMIQRTKERIKRQDGFRV